MCLAITMGERRRARFKPELTGRSPHVASGDRDGAMRGRRQPLTQKSRFQSIRRCQKLAPRSETREIGELRR